MITKVSKRNTTTIPVSIRRYFGIKPGSRLEWRPVEGADAVLVRIVPGRGQLAQRLLGTGQQFAPERDAVAELVDEREQED